MAVVLQWGLPGLIRDGLLETGLLETGLRVVMPAVLDFCWHSFERTQFDRRSNGVDGVCVWMAEAAP